MVQLAGLVVEYLIIGLVCSVWIVLSLLSLGNLQIKPDSSLIIFTPLLYVLGMISDYLGSVILSKWDNKIEYSILIKEGMRIEKFSTGLLNSQLIAHCPDLARALEVRASRYRIARGTLINIPLIGLAIPIAVLFLST